MTKGTERRQKDDRRTLLGTISDRDFLVSFKIFVSLFCTHFVYNFNLSHILLNSLRQVI